jgi:spermidine synthase
MAQFFEFNNQKYVLEFFEDKYLQGWAVDHELFSGQSEFQKVDVVKTQYMGNMLLNDNLVMTSDRDEFSYHEMMAHVPLFSHPDPKKVLIIGGGDGGTAREVLKHKSITKCVMVEIDEMVIEAAREHLPQTSSSFSDPKLEIIIDDGVKYVENTSEKFDVILIDSTDPFGPGAPLFGVEFYRNLKNVLSTGGVVVSQGECAWMAPEAQKNLLAILKQEFKTIGLFNYTNVTYPGGTWSFTWASESLHPLTNFLPIRVEKSQLKFRYYNQGIHRAAFQLPQFYYDLYNDYLTL